MKEEDEEGEGDSGSWMGGVHDGSRSRYVLLSYKVEKQRNAICHKYVTEVHNNKD